MESSTKCALHSKRATYQTQAAINFTQEAASDEEAKVRQVCLPSMPQELNSKIVQSFLPVEYWEPDCKQSLLMSGKIWRFQ